MSSALLQRLADESDIRDVVYRYAHGIDRRRWDELRSCFGTSLVADFTRAGRKEVFDGTADDWVAGLRRLVEGMDGTHHVIANVRMRVDGDRAEASSSFHALHRLLNDTGGSDYTVTGFYDYVLERHESAWRVVRYAATMNIRQGNPHIFKLAAIKEQT
ncbi:MAG: SnoaL-like domain [Ramlibacter sp.]|nr:SnoaL-like domain [Ramlibacter sp.]